MNSNIVSLLRSIGLSEKGAGIYVTALELGEATVQDIARRSGLKRTTIYHVIPELLEYGALLRTTRNKKQLFIAEAPRVLLKRSRERLANFEDALEYFDDLRHSVSPRPRVYFLYGPTGFKQVWDLVFASPERHFLITTSGSGFLSFVREKYIIDEIIKTKKKLGFSSRQLITDSPYSRKIVSKDGMENRESKFLTARHPLPFTEIVTDTMVAFISPRDENLIMVIESESFAKTRRAAFEIVWSSLPPSSEILKKAGVQL